MDAGQVDKTNKHKLLSVHMLGVGRRLRVFPLREKVEAKADAVIKAAVKKNGMA